MDRLSVLGRLLRIPLKELFSLQYVDDDPFLRAEAERIYKIRKSEHLKNNNQKVLVSS